MPSAFCPFHAALKLILTAPLQGEAAVYSMTPGLELWLTHG